MRPEGTNQIGSGERARFAKALGAPRPAGKVQSHAAVMRGLVSRITAWRAEFLAELPEGQTFIFSETPREEARREFLESNTKRTGPAGEFPVYGRGGEA